MQSQKYSKKKSREKLFIHRYVDMLKSSLHITLASLFTQNLEIYSICFSMLLINVLFFVAGH